jgi:hypothetical protein
MLFAYFAVLLRLLSRPCWEFCAVGLTEYFRRCGSSEITRLSIRDFALECQPAFIAFRQVRRTAWDPEHNAAVVMAWWWDYSSSALIAGFRSTLRTFGEFTRPGLRLFAVRPAGGALLLFCDRARRTGIPRCIFEEFAVPGEGNICQKKRKLFASSSGSVVGEHLNFRADNAPGCIKQRTFIAPA